jgi:hypothetical protein
VGYLSVRQKVVKNVVKRECPTVSRTVRTATVHGSFCLIVETDPRKKGLRHSAFIGEKPIRVQKCPKCPNFSDSGPPPVDGRRRMVHFGLCFVRIGRSSAEKRRAHGRPC